MLQKQTFIYWNERRLNRFSERNPMIGSRVVFFPRRITLQLIFKKTKEVKHDQFGYRPQ